MKVGDFVSVGGIVGTVHELGLFGTTIVTPDNVMTIVGNSRVFGDTIQNFSVLPVRRVERVAQLAGSVDPLDAIERFKAAVVKIPNVSTDHPPEVNLLDMNLNGPVIAVRPYTNNAHYWQVDTNGLRISFGSGPADSPNRNTCSDTQRRGQCSGLRLSTRLSPIGACNALPPARPLRPAGLGNLLR